MEPILEFFHKLHDLKELILWGGFAVLAIIVFAETGLLIGFFLPGDSLLFTAGALVGIGVLRAPAPLPSDPASSVAILIALLSFCAIAGDAVGYWFGRKTGPRLFSRPNSRFFRREYLLRTREFYERHGGKTIILARWIPFARTFAPIVAGVAEMPYASFAVFNVLGGITWVASCTLFGYFLGSIPFFQKHNEKVIIGIVLLSVLPVVLHLLKERRRARFAPAAPEEAPEPAQVGSVEG